MSHRSVTTRYPLLAAALAVGGFIALGESWCIFDRWRASQEAAVALDKKKAELHAMGGLQPAPTRAVAAAIEADLGRGQRALNAMQTELRGRGPAAERLRTAKIPTARTDAYFDLATFVEKARELAKTQEVELKPEAARLGFALYANEGPETERIAAVFRQRLVAQYLVESLLEAKPRSVLSIHREAPLTNKEKEDREAALVAAAGGTPPPETTLPTAPEGPDYFAIDPRASARVPGYLEATAFKLSFVGQTAVLRVFLNKLASFELPVLVREVEVDPATSAELATESVASNDEPTAAIAPPEPAATSIVLTTGAAPRESKPIVKPAPTASSTAPIVAKPWCRFTVTVEYIEIVPPAGTEAGPDAEPAKPTT